MTTPYIGLVGLGTMGASLARNAARNGATVAVYNRTTEKTDAFVTAHGSEGKFLPCKTIADLLQTLPQPRAIILMVNAGKPVDDVITELLTTTHYPLTTDDILIDAGNSHFSDTERREKMLSEKNIHFIGMGVSGGEQGALLGPSMMLGGKTEAYERLRPLLSKMAAKDGSGGKCIALIGSGGSGHFVKMVHNGIEYGDMQLIAESYALLKNVLGLENAQIADTFESWNKKRELKSFLIEITAQIFRKRDDLGSGDLIDAIKDEAKQKGTGKWTTQSALDLGVSIPTMTAAVDARFMSSLKSLRVAAAATLGTLDTKNVKLSVNQVRDALLLSKICSYAQGLAMIAVASAEHSWSIDLAETCRVWKGGCIIRSTLLRTFEQAFAEQRDLKNLLLYPAITEQFRKRHQKWRKVVSSGALAGIPLPAMSASLAYFDVLRSAQLPQNLTQAQRDFFGAHTFERTDLEGVFHANWQ